MKRWQWAILALVVMMVVTVVVVDTYCETVTHREDRKCYRLESGAWVPVTGPDIEAGMIILVQDKYGPDRIVYVSGCFDGESSVFQTSHYYDADTKQWVRISPE